MSFHPSSPSLEVKRISLIIDLEKLALKTSAHEKDQEKRYKMREWLYSYNNNITDVFNIKNSDFFVDFSKFCRENSVTFDPPAWDAILNWWSEKYHNQDLRPSSSTRAATVIGPASASRSSR